MGRMWARGVDGRWHSLWLESPSGEARCGAALGPDTEPLFVETRERRLMPTTREGRCAECFLRYPFHDEGHALALSAQRSPSQVGTEPQPPQAEGGP